MSFQPLGDSYVIVKLSYDLYRRGFLVVKHAPKEFEELLREVKVMRNTLGRIQAQLRDGKELTEESKEVFDLSKDALFKFQHFVSRYQRIGLQHANSQQGKKLAD